LFSTVHNEKHTLHAKGCRFPIFYVRVTKKRYQSKKFVIIDAKKEKGE